MCSVTQHHCRRCQMCWKFSQIYLVHSLIACYKKNHLSWPNNLFMAWFELIRMSSYSTNKLQICSVSQHQCRRPQMCEKFHRFTRPLTFCLLQKKFSSPNDPFIARFQLVAMSSCAKNKVQMCSVAQRQCRRRHMCRKLSHIHPVHLLIVCNKNVLSSLNNPFMARFQLISMSSYAKNKLQMCSVTQCQCRRRHMCRKLSQIHPVHLLFVCN